MGVNKLKELRLKKGVSQPRLAVTAGIHTTTIYKIEVGKSIARGDTRRKLAKALGVKQNELE